MLVLTPGRSPPQGEIDPRCIADTNEIYKPTAYQASAKSWTPSDDLWAVIKQQAVGAARIGISGFNSARPDRPMSYGEMSLTTSPDPVGAPIFYRDVPLAPSETKEGQIKPLSGDLVHADRVEASRHFAAGKPAGSRRSADLHELSFFLGRREDDGNGLGRSQR